MQLTRKRIIADAMDLIERDGVEALSMTRLATELGCGLVSLYSYVPSKAALLDGVADALLSGLDPAPRGTRAWPEQIRRQAMAFRVIAVTRPRCTMLVMSRPPSSAMMLRPVERALATLCDAGFDKRTAALITRAVIAYVMGSLLDQFGVAAGLAADGMRRPRLRPAEFPHITALAAEPATSDPDADFEFGLELLVRAVLAMAPKQAVAS